MDPIILSVRCLFSCHGCALKDHPVNVRERRDREDLLAWLDMVRFAIAREHRRVSPACAARECDLKIPLTSTDRIGGPPLQ